MKRISDSEQFLNNVHVIAEPQGEVTSGRRRFFLNALSSWWARRQTAKILKNLSNEQLKDIGLGRREIDKLYGVSGDENRKVWPNWPK
ncbi:DUF1127 domain-containing protein [Rouxiella sp. T17]|uniref:DUF1127 domain-containing protein n=1 Tax=Rouxiella sp. T17 TaxID=3085684 RepID=UPI002FCADA36